MTPTAPTATPSATAMPTSTPQSSSTQAPLAQSGGTLALPSIGGLSGSVTIPANNAPANTTLQVTVIVGGLSGAPTPALRRLAASNTVLFSLEILLSQTVTFSGFPGLSLTLPSSIATAGQSFYVAVYQGTSSTSPLIATLGPAAVSGQTITFAPTTSQITLQGNQTYLLELYEAAAATASPSPAPTTAPTASPTTAPSASPTTAPTASPTTSPTASPTTASAPSAGTTYVLTGSNAIDAFAPGTNGTASTLSAFTFSTGNFVTGITVDASGRTYVAATSQVLSFAYGSAGSATPSTTLNVVAWGLAIDPSGDLVTTDYNNNSVSFFPPGASGSATPLKQIAGGNTQLNYPYQAAFDGSGNLYVLNAGASPSVTEYSAASIAGTGTLSPAPVAVITASSTTIDGPEALAVDTTGRVYVGNSQNNTISVFAAGSNGPTAPAAILSGNTIGFSINQATLAVDASNDLYVASSNSSNAVYVFAPVTASSQTPIRAIAGISYPGGVGIVP